MSQQPNYDQSMTYRGVDRTGHTLVEDEFSADDDAVREFHRRLEGAVDGEIRVFRRQADSNLEYHVTTLRL
jgi:hypothetical protein